MINVGSTETPPAKPPLEEFYLRHLVKRALISHDELIKLIESTYLDVNLADLIKRRFIEKVGSEYHVVPPRERGEKIKDLELLVDYVHRYVYLYNSGKPLEPLPPPELYDDILKMLEYLWKKMKDKQYENIRRLLASQKKTEKTDLTRWITQ